MTTPDKPIEINLDALGLDDWVAFEELKTSGNRSVKAMRDVLIIFLATGGWTPEEVGRLNLAEMQQVMEAVSDQIKGPNGLSGSVSKPPTATAGSSPSGRASAGSPKNGRVPRGKSRPSSA